MDVKNRYVDDKNKTSANRLVIEVSVTIFALFVSGCSTTGVDDSLEQSSSSVQGSQVSSSTKVPEANVYTQKYDGAPKEYVDTSHVRDAVPKEPDVPLKFTPYTLNGIRYEPIATASGYKEKGVASWYGTKFHGKRTANGEIYDMYQMTAAHKTLPLPSYVRVTNLDNGASVVLRVNDRGPFHGERLIDLSYVAAQKLGYADTGLANVQVEGIDPRAFSSSSSQDLNESRVYLQLAALKNHDNAQLLRHSVFSKTEVRAEVVVGEEIEPLYRVRIGPVETPEHLTQLLDKLESANFNSYLVSVALRLRHNYMMIMQQTK